MIVTFCGHRDIYCDSKTKEKLYLCIEKLILNGATEFFLGGYGSFDFLAAQTVAKLKSKYPHITSTLIIPYIDRTYDKNLYNESIYPPIEAVPRRYAISKRNEWMIKKCDVLVCYISRTFGGAYVTYSYAKRMKKKIINIQDL